MAEIFSPQRLQLARQRRGFFKQELAARIDVSVRTVSAWEAGTSIPKDEHIDKLANVLEFPREHFFGDAPPMLEDATFRSLARMTARQRQKALMAGSQAIALDHWIDVHFTRPGPDIPDLRDATPEGAADALRAAWGLGYQPIPNLIHLMERHGIRVYSLVHEGTEVDAFSRWLTGIPFVFLNTTKTSERSRMDAAHEIGHIALHAHTSGGETKEHEDEAQVFAASFLMPRRQFIASAPRFVTLTAIVEAKQMWGVSAMAYVHRLFSLGRLTDWQYRSLCIQIKSRYGNEEPGPQQARETSQVLAKVLTPTKAGGLASRSDIAKALRIHQRDLDEMTFGLILTAVSGGARPVPPTEGGGGASLKLVK